jgi:hypothetical protein
MSSTTISFDPLIPASLFAFLATAGAAALVVYALRRPNALPRARWMSVLTLMVIGFVLVLLTLLNPTLNRPLPGPPGKPLLTILVDASASMATSDCAGNQPRFASAGRVASALASKLGDDYEVRLRTFADAASAADAKSIASQSATGKFTDVAAAIGQSLDQDRPQGQAVVLLSDGINNVGTTARVLDTVHSAKAMATPVYTRTFGGEVNTFDVAVELRSPQDLAFVGQKVPVTVRVKEVGARTAKATVRLVRGSEEIARRETEISPVSTAELVFMVAQDKVGMYPYEVRVEPLEGEVTAANNATSYLLRVVDEPIRVLALEGKPYWDSKFLVRTLASDPAVALDSVVKVADNRFMRRTLSRGGADVTNAATQPSVAQRAETWKVQESASDVIGSADHLKGYQVIVLGRDAEAFLTDAAVTTLQNWIANDGGALVCYRGSPTSQVNQRLAKLMPVQWTPTPETRFRVKLTEPGRGMNWWPTQGSGEMLAGLPTLVSAQTVESTKPLAVVLATSTGSSGAGGASAETPAVIYQQYGTGRVVVIEGAGMWRWAFLPPQYQSQEEIYRGLWQSLLRWLISGGESLTPGKQMMLRADKVTFLSTEPATATLLLREEANRRGEIPKIELSSTDSGAGAAPTNQPKVFAPAAVGEEVGTYRVNFGVLPEGRYVAKAAGAKADDASAVAVLEVRNVSEEQLDLRARPDLMQRIADDSGGTVLSSDDVANELAAKFKQHLARTRPTQVEHVPAWDHWWAMIGLILVWGASWAMRRASGLV